MLSLTCALLADGWTNNVVVLAASAYGGSVGYYGALLLHEITGNRRAVLRGMRSLVAEFGSAEALDSLVFSPVLLRVCVALIPNVPLAVLLGEIASTAVFYGVVLLGHKRCIRGTYRRYAKLLRWW